MSVELHQTLMQLDFHISKLFYLMLKSQLIGLPNMNKNVEQLYTHVTNTRVSVL